MSDNPKPTQASQPRTDADPVEIPVPSRDDVLRDLAKVAPPVKPLAKPAGRPHVRPRR